MKARRETQSEVVNTKRREPNAESESQYPKASVLGKLLVNTQIISVKHVLSKYAFHLNLNVPSVF